MSAISKRVEEGKKVTLAAIKEDLRNDIHGYLSFATEEQITKIENLKEFRHLDVWQYWMDAKEEMEYLLQEAREEFGF